MSEPGGDSVSDEGQRRARGPFIVATVVVALLAVISGAAIAVMVAGSRAEETPVVTRSATQEPRDVPDDEAAAVLTGLHPTDCEQIYSATMWDYLESTGLALNDPSVEGNVGTADDELRAVIEASPEPLSCSWGAAGDYGMTTTIARVGTDDEAAVLARLEALGSSCYEQSSGTRCASSTWEDGNRLGESHFVRDGVWISTHWVNFAPDGYTESIVSTLWPEG